MREECKSDIILDIQDITKQIRRQLELKGGKDSFYLLNNMSQLELLKYRRNLLEQLHLLERWN